MLVDPLPVVRIRSGAIAVQSRKLQDTAGADVQELDPADV